MSTDAEWEQWGRQDPYFGVITQERFRNTALDATARREFFESGVLHAEHVWASCQRHVNPQFAPQSVLDFGCGVGRVLLPFARRAKRVVGVDVADSMLLEARRNCDEAGLQHVQLVRSDDGLTEVDGTFDLVHSVIVLQHIAPERGLQILARLLGLIAPGGVGAIQITYAKMIHAESLGVPIAVNLTAMRSSASPLNSPSGRRGLLAALAGGAPPFAGSAAAAGIGCPGADPEMQMNSYHLNQVFFVLQCAGFTRVHTEFTDHGGELGVFLFVGREQP